MIQQIRRFNTGQTAKVAAALYGLAGLILMPLFLAGALMEPKEDGITVGFALALPLVYAVLGYLATAVGCGLYNWLAGKIGGIEIELATIASGAEAAAARPGAGSD